MSFFNSFLNNIINGKRFIDICYNGFIFFGKLVNCEMEIKGFNFVNNGF